MMILNAQKWLGWGGIEREICLNGKGLQEGWSYRGDHSFQNGRQRSTCLAGDVEWRNKEDICGRPLDDGKTGKRQQVNT